LYKFIDMSVSVGFLLSHVTVLAMFQFYLYSSLSITRIIKSRMKTWIRHIVHMM
jgi:hypothetical protein